MYVQCSEILCREGICSMRHVLVSTLWSSQARETEGNECFHRWDLVWQKARRQELNLTRGAWNVSEKSGGSVSSCEHCLVDL